jgi:hypothetical protein
MEGGGGVAHWLSPSQLELYPPPDRFHPPFPRFDYAQREGQSQDLVDGLKSHEIGTADLELWVYGRLNANPYMILFTSDSINSKGRRYWDY